MAGVGTIISQTLHSFGISENSGCGCVAISTEMNHDGPDKVEEKLNYYVEKMHVSINRWRKEHIMLIPTPPTFVIEQLILYAVRKART